MELPQEETQAKENCHHSISLLRAVMGVKCPDMGFIHDSEPLEPPAFSRWINGLPVSLTLALPHFCAPCHPVSPCCYLMAQLGKFTLQRCGHCLQLTFMEQPLSAIPAPGLSLSPALLR